ncbi:hypothetical protein CHLRE_16g648200v5 [Chlamydomonas reinhardtii]|uniref:Cytochrome P450, CYP711 clan n=1 Tax=Chlamydomonas reinhardtii TaxID=3055 RepID=A0A2K3CSP0_CHLRE|nr:uncharacterized protein CHLRE_16g648200v5 [Chlamydomonas reinhardtii]PNW71295.1 hypothetical protein CHLRE_16g648200v5 [Chlamydomonas reinhardtii]
MALLEQALRAGLQFALTPLGALCIIAGVALTWLGWAPVTRWRLRNIPGPFALPFLGHLPAISARDLVHFCHDVARQYGPVAQVWVAARPWIVVSDPVAARKIAYRSLARPSTVASFTHALVGEPRQVDDESIFWNRGPAWKASRRAFETSVLRPDRLAAHMPAVRRCTERFLARLAPYADGSTAVDMKDEYGVIALAITGEVAYGVSFWPSDEDAALLAAPTGGSGAATSSSSSSSSSSKSPSSALVRACHECMACFELPLATMYLPLQMLLPALRPLWLALAAALPDAAQRRHMEARQAVADVSRRLMREWQQQAAARANDSGGDGLLLKDQTPVVNGGSSSSGSGGISSSSFLAAMLKDQTGSNTACASSSGTDGGVGGGGGGSARGSESGTGPRVSGSGSGNGGGGGTEPPPRMSETQVISQGLSFILAGYDTTGTTLALTTFLLAHNPTTQEKLRAELVENRELLDSADGLAQLPYLDAVLKESQRLHPAVGHFWRDATSDIALPEMGGLVIPKGSFVSISIYNMHRDPAHWKEPERFIPERFLQATGGALGPTDPGAYVPFGSGPRMCVGYKMAIMVGASVRVCMRMCACVCVNEVLASECECKTPSRAPG